MSQHRSLFEAAYQIKQYEEALKQASLAIAADPEDPDTYLYLAKALFKLRRYEESLEALEIAITKDAHWWGYHYTKGVYLLHMFQSAGDEEKSSSHLTIALEAAEEAIRLAPNQASAHMILAEIMEEMKVDDESSTCSVERALSLDPANPSLLRRAGDFWLDREENSPPNFTWRWAVYYLLCLVLVLLSPASTSFMAMYAMVHPIFIVWLVYQRRRARHVLLKKTERLYRESLQIEPNNALALNNLGCALRRLKQEEKALLAFRSALIVDPTLKVAQENTHSSIRDWVGGVGISSTILFIVLKVLEFKFLLFILLLTQNPILWILFIGFIGFFLWQRYKRLAKIKAIDPELLSIFAKLEEDHSAGRLS